MSSDGKLSSIDTDAVSDAVDALEGEDFDVMDVDSIERAGQGVEFDLSVRKLTRSAGFATVDEDDETVEVSVEAVETAFDELDRLIDETEGDEPDPLTDRTFRARDEFADVLDVEVDGGDDGR